MAHAHSHGHSHSHGHGHSHGAPSGDGEDRNANFYKVSFSQWYAQHAAPMSLTMLEATLAALPSAAGVLSSAANVLDVGAGTGSLTRWLVEHANQEAEILALDPSQPMLDQLSALQLPRVRTVLCAGENMEAVADDSVDLIVCCLSVHHMDDVPAVFREFRRVLREGGAVIVVEFQEGQNNPFWDSALKREAVAIANAAVGGTAPEGSDVHSHNHEHDLSFSNVDKAGEIVRAAGFTTTLEPCEASVTWTSEVFGPAMVFQVNAMLCDQLRTDEAAAEAQMSAALTQMEVTPTMHMRGYLIR